MTTTPDPMVPRPKKAAKMMPRPKRTPRAATPALPAPAVAPAPPVEVLTRPDLRQPWERYADALVVLIARSESELERYLLRMALLKARHTPYK